MALLLTLSLQPHDLQSLEGTKNEATERSSLNSMRIETSHEMALSSVRGNIKINVKMEKIIKTYIIDSPNSPQTFYSLKIVIHVMPLKYKVVQLLRGLSLRLA